MLAVSLPWVQLYSMPRQTINVTELVVRCIIINRSLLHILAPTSSLYPKELMLQSPIWSHIKTPNTFLWATQSSHHCLHIICWLCLILHEYYARRLWWLLTLALSLRVLGLFYLTSRVLSCVNLTLHRVLGFINLCFFSELFITTISSAAIKIIYCFIH